MDDSVVDTETKHLVKEIQRLGKKTGDGKYSVKFGVLFNDEKCANYFEALIGTMRAAKKRKMIDFEGEILFQGTHDDVDVKTLVDAE